MVSKSGSVSKTLEEVTEDIRVALSGLSVESLKYVCATIDTIIADKIVRGEDG